MKTQKNAILTLYNLLLSNINNVSARTFDENPEKNPKHTNSHKTPKHSQRDIVYTVTKTTMQKTADNVTQQWMF